MLTARPLPGLSIDTLTDELSDSCVLFDRLLDERAPGAPFQTFEWISSWWESRSPGRSPVVLLAHDRGVPKGLLPLYLESGAFDGQHLRLMADEEVGADYIGVIAQPSDRARVSAAFAEYLASRNEQTPILDGLEADDPLVAALAQAGALVEPRYLCPRINLCGSFTDYLNERPDGTGHQWQRRLKWLERQNGFELRCETAPDAVAQSMETLFALHDARWNLGEGSEAFTAPWIFNFHRRTARALAERGWVRIYSLSVDGQVRAILYGFRHGDRFAFFQSGHEPTWRKRSVGTVLLGHVIRCCFEEGLTEFDFLHGSEPYKQLWSNGARHTVRARMNRTGLRPLISSTTRRIYHQSKQLLPESALRYARRARKYLRRWGEST